MVKKILILINIVLVIIAGIKFIHKSIFYEFDYIAMTLFLMVLLAVFIFNMSIDVEVMKCEEKEIV